MRAPQVQFTSIALAVAACFSTPIARSETNDWIVNSDGYWHDAANWSNGVPTSTTDAVINIAGNRTITYYGARVPTIHSLAILDNTLAVQSTALTISGAYNNTGTGQTIIGHNGTLILNGTSVMDTLVVNDDFGYAYVYGQGTSTIRDLKLVNGTLGSYQYANSGPMTVTGQAQFNGGSFVSVLNQTVNLNGTATWSAGNGYINLAGASSLNIAAGTTFQDLGTQTVTGSRILASTSSGTVSGVVNNLGSYVRSGLGTTKLGAMQNSGLLNIQAGRLQITEGLTNTGTVQIDTGATLAFRDPRGTRSSNSLNAGQLINEGILSFEIGQLDIKNDVKLSGKGEWRFASSDYYDVMRFTGAHEINKLSINGLGTLDILGTLTTQTLDFSKGTVGQYFKGPGALVVTGDAVLQSGTSKAIAAGYQLVLNGQTRWAAGDYNTLGLHSGESLIIGASGSFVDEGNGAVYRSLGTYNAASITNNGRFIRNGSGTSTLSSVFNNRGEVVLNSGELRVAAGGNSTGRIAIGPNATQSFADGSSSWPSTTTFTLGGTLSNDGLLRVDGGTAILDQSLQYSGKGQVSITGGTLKTNLATVWQVQTLNISGGAAVLQQDTTAQALSMDGGSRGGNGTLTVGRFNFNGGELGNFQYAPGKTIVNGLTTIAGNGNQAVSYGHQLFLNGDTVWTAGTGGINFNYSWTPDGSSAIHLAQGATFLDQGGPGSRYLGMYSEYGSSSGVIHNAGRYVREGDGITYANTFRNTGSVDLRTGSLYFHGGGSNQGAIKVASGATLGVTSGQFQLQSNSTLSNMGTLLVSGYLDIDAGARYSGDGAITLAGGVLRSRLNETISASDITLRGAAVLAGNVKTNSLLIGADAPSTVPGSLSGPGTVTTKSLKLVSAELGNSSERGGALIATGNAEIGGDAWHRISDGYKLDLQGETTWQASNSFAMLGISSGSQGAGEVRIGTQGVFRDLGMSNSTDSRMLGLTGGLLYNMGTYERSGQGRTDIYAGLTNTGRIVVKEGTLRIQQGLDNTGAIEARGGRIEINNVNQFAQFDRSSGALTGGSYRVVGEAPIAMSLGYKANGQTPALIDVNQAQISLEGQSAHIVAVVGTQEQDALSQLRRNEGELQLLAGAQLIIHGNLQQAGRLVIGHGSQMSTGTFTQESGATFLNGQLSGKTLQFDKGTLSAGEGEGSIGQGKLAGGQVSLGHALQLTVDLNDQQGWDELWIDGDIALGGTLLANFQDLPASGGSYQILSTNGLITSRFDRIDTNLDATRYSVYAVYGSDRVSLSITQVPEPSTLLLMVLGLAGLSAHGRSRRR